MPTAQPRPVRALVGPWPDVGPRWGCVASAELFWAILGPMLPHLDAMSAHRKHMLSNLGPMLAQKKTKRKIHGKTMGSQGFATMVTGCWPILEAMLVHLGAMLAHLGAMLGRLGATLVRFGR